MKKILSFSPSICTSFYGLLFLAILCVHILKDDTVIGKTALLHNHRTMSKAQLKIDNLHIFVIKRNYKQFKFTRRVNTTQTSLIQSITAHKGCLEEYFELNQIKN